MKRGKLSFNQILLMFALIPLLIGIVTLAVYSINKLDEKLEENTYSRLRACAKSVQKYFEWDIREDILEIDDVSEDFIDSLKDQGIELTLFEKDTRWLTSVLNDNGQRNNGTTCNADIWATVSKGEDYKADKVKIAGKDYYTYYTPVCNEDGTIWGMAFAGETESIVNEAKREALITILVLAAGIVVAIIVVVLVVARIVASPLKKVAKALEDTSEGSLSADTNIHSITKETCQIINSAKKLQDVLGDTITNTKNIGGNVSTGSNLVSSLSQACSNNAEQISHAMEDLSNGAVSMAENVQSINHQVVDMGRAIENISENTTNLVNSSNKIKVANEDATKQMNNVSDSSIKSVNAVNSISEEIAETNKAVENIRNAVDMIISIASQTNLLSLNASIEAARAGEAGKGFAVVASEIKGLAEQSNNSAEQIKNIVEDIIARSNQLVNLSSEVNILITEEQGYINDTKEKFKMLGAEIDQSLQQIETIDKLTTELNTSKDAISISVEELSAVSEENSASNEEITASISDVAQSIVQIADSSKETNDLVDNLNQTIAYFN